MASSMVDSLPEIFLPPPPHMFEKWLTPWKAQIVLVDGNILFIKIEIKCLAGQNLEIMTFRYHYLMLSFLESIVTDN